MFQSDREFLCKLSEDLISYLTKATDRHVQSLANQPSEYKVTTTAGRQTQKGPIEKHVCTPECMMKCAVASRDGELCSHSFFVS